MLLNGGALEGVRLLKPETVELMTRNQIGTLDMPFKEHGTKFGYGFGIVSTGARAEEVSSMGSYSWDLSYLLLGGSQKETDRDTHDAAVSVLATQHSGGLQALGLRRAQRRMIRLPRTGLVCPSAAPAPCTMTRGCSQGGR